MKSAKESGGRLFKPCSRRTTNQSLDALKCSYDDRKHYAQNALRTLLEKKSVSAIDVREIRFQPGQQTGLHRHPCPVVGFIASGAAIVEVEGHPLQALPQGSAFYEPEDAVIHRFDNASDTEPMTFIAFYLLEGDEPLIEMLPEKTE